MKNKTRVPRKLPVSKEVSLADLPLKTDELIDLYEQSYKASVNVVMEIVGKTLSVLLFLGNALIQGDTDKTLVVRLKDRDVDYCSGDNGIADIIEMLSVPLYEARNRIDEDSLKVSSAMDRYRKAHPKVASA
jgi:hypothetical protein